MEHYGLLSLLPTIVALGLAIWSKRVIESLLAGLLTGVLIMDTMVNGLGHSILFAIPNLFDVIVGHPANQEAGLQGIGILSGTSLPKIFIVVLMLGSFITVLEKSGGALAFGDWLAKKVKTKQGAQTATGIMGCSLFTSSYFSSLATGTVFRPIYDRIKISREKLSFFLDATAAPINVLVPVSGWVAYMTILVEENLPSVENGIAGLVKTIPYNFYNIFMIIFVFLLANNIIKDYGPMKKIEEKYARGEIDYNDNETDSVKDTKDGNASDMLWPLAASVISLVILGSWNYTLASVPFFSKLGVPSIPLGSRDMLLISFSLGLIVAFIKYVFSGLMSAEEFLDEAIDGTKSAITGGIIIILAVTLGDMVQVAAPEGLGGAKYIAAIAKGNIYPSILPFATFFICGAMSFSLGTSFGTWGIMMPLIMPIALTAGVNPFLAVAAVLSGGTFGDHCSPISDTTVMSSIGAGCEHMDHVNTQLPYALTVASIASVFFLVAGFIV
ncbi:Na+/H+ antiporter [Halobacteroides halobius DSM 5150]|uniref:Na+/H+ antiporter n=1 Tax=Halobacteroides halobius (strain ATCC 35273 / DSM 5150 / MD-1) TaxID=748449 RepID=L0K525_HALHC|nr:Na+/H+ antiporter NhaC family protein [Halobacteroides halobius]AGB40357.1 Na+/H+ antiporter [Halobacteroides halobius DSM 5150]